MSFRRRLTLLVAGAVAISIALAAAAAYFLVRAELRDQIDQSLLERGTLAQGLGGASPFGPGRGGPPPGDGTPPPRGGLQPPQDLGEPDVVGQVVAPDGEIVRRLGLDNDQSLPTGPAEELLAAGGGQTFSDETVDGESLRMLSIAPGAELAVQLARSLEEVDSTLSRLALIMGLIALAGIGAAAGFGLTVARAALSPVTRLSETADEVARTEDLSRRIEIEGEDELARLGASFNTMMASLEQSVGAQKQLVADASHELRTPLTSLRTNIETLARRPEMPEADRRQLLHDLESELGELGRLVDDIVDLAREGAEEAMGGPTEMRVDEIVAGCVDRARRRAGEISISAELDPTLLTGRPERIDRAVGNLLDNATKWTPAGGRIEVRLQDGTITVSDSGDGIAEDDLDHVFDRFYRAPAARGTRGSGLGLAIVKQVAEAHGGSVAAGRATLGGARLTLSLPGSESAERAAAEPAGASE